MSDTIIAAYDGSPGARDALALATVLADADPARPTHVTVVSVYRFTPLGDPSVAGEYERLFHEAATERLDEARRAVEGRDDVRFRVVRGTSAADGLHRVAEAEGASCIVVGGSHTGALGRVLPGSVTEQTLHGAPCAVAVAPAGYANGEPGIRTVGVAFDDSTEARHALGHAADLARRFGAALRIVRVLDEQVVWYGGYAGPVRRRRARAGRG
ncbi:universal stress protein [Patulibacter sp. S7RM1-6]